MINFEFIQDLEGNSLVGYVPDLENSNSGVTIASGFDLGQRSNVNGLPAQLAEKLKRYVGFKGQDAQLVLSMEQLVVTEQEATVINKYAHDESEGRLVEAFEKEGLDFYELPDECQTVIASVAFQYGNLEIKTPNFWQQVTSCDWPSALENLRNFGDRYTTRRNKEADYLESWLMEQHA